MDFIKAHIFEIIQLIPSLITLIVGLIISKKLARFNSRLDRSNVVFSRFHDLQVEALKSIYTKLVNFHSANNILLKSKYEANRHDDLKKRITNWITCYITCANEFSKEKILLSPKLKKEFQTMLDSFDQTKQILLDAKNELLEDEYMAQGVWQEMYYGEEDELGSINSKLEKIRQEKNVIISEFNIKQLREHIERHFEQMV